MVNIVVEYFCQSFSSHLSKGHGLVEGVAKRRLFGTRKVTIGNFCSTCHGHSETEISQWNLLNAMA